MGDGDWGGAKEEEEGEGADQDNLITDYTRAVKRTSRNVLMPEVPLTALMFQLSVRKRFQCSRGRSATGHSIWASLPLGDFHVYFCLGN